MIPPIQAARPTPDGLARPPRTPHAGPRERAAAPVEMKLWMPQLRPETVSRRRLVDRLSSSHDRNVVAVSAPAGYGKTTALVEWARQDDRDFAWVSLDPTDNDPVVLLSAISAAFDRVQPVDPAIFDDLASPGISILGRVVPRLAASLRSAAEPFVLVLDDLHDVESDECRDAVGMLADQLPEGSQIATASRDEVWLASARRRARGEVLDIGAIDLAFDHEEAAQLLARTGVHLEADALHELTRRTEGWPAGLYLGALALRGGPANGVPLALFAGDERHIADYLRSEVLHRTPADTLQFLTRTAVLDTMCGALCDATLPGEGSAGMLEALERSNLFLVPLDHRREWYRYHALFREFLQAELLRREPSLVPELHRRAADWFEANGMPERAIDHAHASGDTPRAARLVSSRLIHAYDEGRIATVERWLRTFDSSAFERHPPLAVLAGWICALTGRAPEAARWADAAERGSFSGPVPDGSASIESARAMLSAAMCAQGITKMNADAEFAVAHEPPWSSWRPTALQVLAEARCLAGRTADGEAILAEWLDTVEAADGTMSMVRALTRRSLNAMGCEEWESAETDLHRAHAIIAKWRFHEYVLAAGTFAASARLAIHHHDLQAARDDFMHAMRLRTQATWALPTHAVELRVELANICLGLADPAGARNLLREIDDILRRRPDIGLLNAQVDELRERLASAPAGAVGVSTLTPAELRLLPYLPTHLTFREIGARLFISRNTVATESGSIYRKLGASSRGEAVTNARALGLLTG